MIVGLILDAFAFAVFGCAWFLTGRARRLLDESEANLDNSRKLIEEFSISDQEALRRVLALCDKWDVMSKGESMTTHQIRVTISDVR